MNIGKGGDFEKSGELFVCKYIQKQLNEEPVVIIFDVGANLGNYAIAVSNAFKSNAKIFSFEPSKKTFDLLLTTIKNSTNITPYNFGFSNEENTKTLFTNSDRSELASLYNRNLEQYSMKMDGIEEIKLKSIDNFCAENKIVRIHFLKLDIEGHEIKALQGAKNMISNNKIDYIQFEFGGSNIDSRTYFQDFFYLLKDKYKIYRILKDSIYELKSYKKTYEVFNTVNYLAIKK